MVVGQSEALAERLGPNFGVVVGGDGGIACALGKTEGGKAPAAYLRGSCSRTTTLRLRTTTAMRTTAPRSRRGARPARQVSAHGFNPKRRRACLLRRRPRRGRHQYSHRGKGWQR